MTFLPVAERELRVAARKRAAYWVRTAAAAVALGIGGLMSVPYLAGGMPGVRLGSVLFGILTWLTFMACLSAGLFFTSDSISQEKREGTLGFLFLTDLRGLDVLLGKLIATSVRASFALLAVMPVLALPMLMGGVEATQFWKCGGASLNALLCSLAAGIFVSTLCRTASRAFSGTLLLLIVWCGLGPVIGTVYREMTGKPLLERLSWTSPMFTFTAAEPGTGAGSFWGSWLVNLAIAVGLMGAASVLVRRTWQEGRRSGTTSGERKLGAGRRRRSRGRLRKWMDPNPVVWLVRRSGRQADGVWVLALLALAVVVIAWLVDVRGQAWIFWNVAGSLFSMVLFVMAAAQTPRVFVEARQNGLMELLMSTPLRTEEIAGGHWRAQVRMFAPPLLLFALVHGAGTGLSTSSMWASAGIGGATAVEHAMLGVVVGFTTAAGLLADMAALAWFGMWMGMRSKNNNMATLKTLAFVQVAPAIVLGVLSSLIVMLVMMPTLIASQGANAATRMMGTTFPLLSAFVPLTLKLGKDALFIIWSRKQLHRNLRWWAMPAFAATWSMPVPPVIQAAQPPLAKA